MLNQHARRILSDRYTVGTEQPEDIFKRVAEAYGSNEEHSARLLSYMEKLWFIPATPILSNGGTWPRRGEPISCFLNMVPDSREGIAEHITETIWMSTNGGGVGTDWSALRSVGTVTSRGAATTGGMAYMHILDSVSRAANQGSTRRGGYCSYMSVSHPEIKEHIQMRNKSGGDIHRKNFYLHHGVNIPDAFMHAVDNDSEWKLIDPHTQEVKEVLRARELWHMILDARDDDGEPFLHFVDRSNEFLHPDLKAQGMQVRGSNLCSEITLPTDNDYSAVCCLSSVNLDTFHEWEHDKLFVGDVVEMLDNVLQDFIDNGPEYLWRAKVSAEHERSIGLGTMGYHSFLQRNSVPFESPAARGWNIKLFNHIKRECQFANERLAQTRGPAQGLKTDRFAHMMAIAPNASTSLIAGVSPSIEPWNSNLFVQKTLSGALVIRNPHLEALLRHRLGSEAENAWSIILDDEGSVQQLECLTDHEKAVYKTAWEMDQRSIINQAADRQKYICQAQSVNLFFPSGKNRGYYNRAHRMAWELGLKTLYYSRTTPVRSMEKVTYNAKSACAGGVCEG